MATTDKSVYNVYYNKEDGKLYGDTVINIIDEGDGSYIYINFNDNEKYIKLKRDSFSFIIEKDTNATALNTVNFSKTYNLSLLKDPPTVYDSHGTALVQRPIVLYDFKINLYVIENLKITANIKSLSYTLARENTATFSDTFTLNNVTGSSFTITSPSWVTVTPNTGNTTTEIKIEIQTYFLPENYYSGEIIVTAGTNVLKIPIEIFIKNFINYETKNFYFALDGDLIEVRKANNLAKIVRATISMLIGEQTIEREFKGAYFNDIYQLNIGEKVNPYFSKTFKNILNKNSEAGEYTEQSVLKPIIVNVLIEELNEFYNVLNTKRINNLKFYPGKKPKQYPFLTNVPVRSRLEGSKQIISYISGEILPNEISQMILKETKATTGDIVSVVLSDENYLVIWPSKKTFSKETGKIDVYTRHSGPNIINIQWQNENLAPEYLSVSGEYKINEDFTHSIDNDLVIPKKFESSSRNILTLNTGFYLKPEEQIISELIKSRFCFIEINGKYYEGFCTNQKFSKKDSTQELFQTDLEIIILNYED